MSKLLHEVTLTYHAKTKKREKIAMKTFYALEYTRTDRLSLTVSLKAFAGKIERDKWINSHKGRYRKAVSVQKLISMFRGLSAKDFAAHPKYEPHA